MGLPSTLWSPCLHSCRLVDAFKVFITSSLCFDHEVALGFDKWAVVTVLLLSSSSSYTAQQKRWFASLHARSFGHANCCRKLQRCSGRTPTASCSRGCTCALSHAYDTACPSQISPWAHYGSCRLGGVERRPALNHHRLSHSTRTGTSRTLCDPANKRRAVCCIR